MITNCARRSFGYYTSFQQTTTHDEEINSILRWPR